MTDQAIKALIDNIDENNYKDVIKVNIKPENIDFFNKIIEAYDNLALVTTIDKEKGDLVLWVTPDTAKDVKKIIKKIPIKVKILG